MMASIDILLASLYGARHLDLDYIGSYNAMDTLHIVTTCSSGDVHTVSFPDYSNDIGLFSDDVEVEFTEITDRNGVAGFRLFQRSLNPMSPVFGSQILHKINVILNHDACLVKRARHERVCLVREVGQKPPNLQGSRGILRDRCDSR